MSYKAPEDSVFGVGFLDRLEIDAKPVSFNQGPNSFDVMSSIKRNISNVLNTRIGGSASAPNLGLIDFNDATLEAVDLSKTIRLAIQRSLDSYEPRLKNIMVHRISDFNNDLLLRFQISAQLNHDAIHEKVELNLMLDQNRKYRVL